MMSGQGSNLAALLRDTAKAIRPHIEQTLNLRDTFAEYRKAVTDAGGDWMALKNLVKAQIEDERDEEGGERVAKLLARADLAAAYADILGVANENFSFSEAVTGPKEIGPKPSAAKGSEAITSPEGIGPNPGTTVPKDAPDLSFRDEGNGVVSVAMNDALISEIAAATPPLNTRLPGTGAMQAPATITSTNRGKPIDDIPPELRRKSA